MAARPTKKPRPVFLSAAVARLVRQPWRKRARAASAIASFVLRDAAWWLAHGVWHVPRTLRLARARALLPVHPAIPTPALHVYAHPAHADYAHRCIAQCALHAHENTPPASPLVLYVHGGAWAAGHAAHYSQLAHTILSKSDATVLVLSYRLYPAAKIHHQVDDVAAALRRARLVFPRRHLVLLAHSSGANVAALALLRHAQSNPTSALADVAIFTAGPFHLMHHYLFEARRGVADISPMLPAASADPDHTQFDNSSPSVIAEQMTTALRQVSLPDPPHALEGHVAASNVPLPSAATHQTAAPFPQTYILTSSCDTIVPIYSSLRFAAALRNRGLDATLLVYDGASHADFVTDWFHRASSRDHSDLLDVDDADLRRRVACVTHLAGPPHAQLVEHPDLQLGPTPYVRDVLRILNSLKKLPTPDHDHPV